jgi:hypothetical protein
VSRIVHLPSKSSKYHKLRLSHGVAFVGTVKARRLNEPIASADGHMAFEESRTWYHSDSHSLLAVSPTQLFMLNLSSSRSLNRNYHDIFGIDTNL